MSFIFLIILILIIAVLGIIGVLIDRINFPQKPFRSKLAPDDASRDRTGAHILEPHEAEEE